MILKSTDSLEVLIGSQCLQKERHQYMFPQCLILKECNKITDLSQLKKQLVRQQL
jgi:hypothetical protein